MSSRSDGGCHQGPFWAPFEMVACCPKIAMWTLPFGGPMPIRCCRPPFKRHWRQQVWCPFICPFIFNIVSVGKLRTCAFFFLNLWWFLWFFHLVLCRALWKRTSCNLQLHLISHMNHFSSLLSSKKALFVFQLVLRVSFLKQTEVFAWCKFQPPPTLAVFMADWLATYLMWTHTWQTWRQVSSCFFFFFFFWPFGWPTEQSQN